MQNIKESGVRGQRDSCNREFQPLFPEDIPNKCNFDFIVQ